MNPFKIYKPLCRPRVFPFVLLGLIVVFAIFWDAPAPPRVEGIPVDAVWAGDLDHGYWFSCIKNGDSPDRYECTIYDDMTGKIAVFGEFVIRESKRDSAKGAHEYASVTEIPDKIVPTDYDGIVITLEDSLVLVPDGWVSYPRHNGTTKAKLYALGKLQEEVEHIGN